jgi:hypothetical protein
VDAIKILEKMVKIRQEILEVSDTLKHLQGELDLQVHEMILVLKDKGIIKSS